MDIHERRRLALEALGIRGDGLPRKRKFYGPNKRPRPLRTFLKPLDANRSDKFSYSSCRKKMRYASHSDATRQAHKAETKRGVKLRVYYCKYCNGYHLTKSTYIPGLHQH